MRAIFCEESGHLRLKKLNMMDKREIDVNKKIVWDENFRKEMFFSFKKVMNK